jgi:predicted lipoprotein with Yx(FWY)xxD motif
VGVLGLGNTTRDLTGDYLEASATVRPHARSVTKFTHPTEGASMTRTKSITFLAGATALVVAALAAGCGSSGGSNANSPAAPTNASGQPATVGVGSVALGKILVDSRAHTLYLFKKDSGTTSSCFGACAANWPPLRARGAPTVGSGAKESLVATTMRSDGKAQVTYNGHPLYTFSGDEKAGDTNGEGVNAFGGNWYVLDPSGNKIVTSTSTGY